jgi:GTP-binding protein
MTTSAWNDYLIKSFTSMRHVPVAFVTAKESKNVRQLVNLAQSIFKQARIRVPTSEVNRVVRAAVDANPPPLRRNRRAKVFFATQVSTEPPTIVLKVNDPILFDEAWKRYLLGALREELPFKEVPIRLYFRSHHRKPDDALDEEESLEDATPVEEADD